MRVDRCVSGSVVSTSCGVYTTSFNSCRINYAYVYTVPTNSAGQNPTLQFKCPGSFYLSNLGAWDQSQPGVVMQTWVDETNTGYISINQNTGSTTYVKVYAICEK